MKKNFVILSIIFIFSNLLSTGSANAENKNVMFIFDASGSMWGQIDGKNKIVIAKEAMSKLIKDLPDDMNVGLVVYGHREKKSSVHVQKCAGFVVYVVLDSSTLLKTTPKKSPA